MNKLKNVVIINDFNYIQGGASKVAIDTANLLVEKYSDLNVYFFSAVMSNKHQLDKRIINICLNQNEAIVDKKRVQGFINGIYNFKARNELKKLLTTLNKNNTVIHIHGWTKALSSSIFDIAFKLKFKIVLTLHDYFILCPNGGFFNYKTNKICNLKPLSIKCIKCNCDSRNYMIKLYRVLRQIVQSKFVKLNTKLENVITISEFSENILQESLNNNTKIVRIYNPIDLNKQIKKIDTTKKKYYLYVGRVSKEKGVDLFCQAITELDLKGLVVGDGTEKNKLEILFPNINFVGWKDKEDVKKYMENAIALIFPSRWYETAGLTILEAMALGIPCIVSNNCAGREFIKDGLNGYLFNNIEELKEKIIKSKKFKMTNSFNLEKFNSKNYITNIINFFESII